MRRRFVILCAAGLLTVLWTVGYFSTHTHRATNFAHDVTTRFPDVITFRGDVENTQACPNVMTGMVKGQWVPRQNVSARERQEMDKYLERLRGEYNLPPSLQRPDGACDKVGFQGVTAARFMWFRALCDPKGPTPCCQDSRCVRRSMADCRCDSCLDTRVPVHAELSQWKPKNPECHVHEFSASEACDLLKGTTLVLAGDSFVRHVFVALVMLLTNNFRDGALKTDADPDVRKTCLGMYQINGIKCRALLDQNRTLCDGAVHAIYIEIFSMWQGRFLLPEIQGMTSRGHRVLLMTGIGIHDDFLGHLIWTMFVQPLVDYVTVPDKRNATQISLRRWPKLLWAGTHAPNLLKSPYTSPWQTSASVLRYNSEMKQHLRLYGIPVLDTFNMTAPLHSVDGTHYGYGANTLKVQFLLNWVQERQLRNEW